MEIGQVRYSGEEIGQLLRRYQLNTDLSAKTMSCQILTCDIRVFVK